MEAKGLLVVGLLAALVLALAAGCVVPATGGAPAAPSPRAEKAAATAPATPAPDTGGRVVVGVRTLYVPSLNPGMAASLSDLRVLAPMYDSLVWRDSAGELQPGIAAAWENRDELTWAFTLRDDLAFHDGSPVTADDVTGTFDFYRDPEAAQRAGLNLSTIAEVTTEGSTVVITTSEPDPTLPNRLALAMILPIEQVLDRGAEAFAADPVGTGPFRPTFVDPQSRVDFVAMGPGWETPKGTPNVSELVFQVIPEAATRTAAIQSGEIDMVFDIEGAAATSAAGDGVEVATVPGGAAASYTMDVSEGPTADIRVRQAINHAVDKAGMNEAINAGEGILDAQLIGAPVLGYNDELEPIPFDPDRARELLAEAGYADGFTIEIRGSDRSLYFAEPIGEYLRQVGINGEISLSESSVWIEEWFSGPERRRGLWFQGITWEPMMDASIVYRWYSSDVPLEQGGRWEDPEFDQIYQEAKATFDPELRAERFREAARYLHEQVPVLFLFTGPRFQLVGPDIDWEPSWAPDMFIANLDRR